MANNKNQRFYELRQFLWTLEVISIPNVMKFKYKVQYVTKTIHEFSECNWFSNFWEHRGCVEWLINRADFCSVRAKDYRFFRQINYLVISLVKPLLSRNFCEKCVRLKSQQFPYCLESVEITAVYSHTVFQF